MPLSIRSANACQIDQLSLGETMIRLSPPGHGRIEFANSMEAWVGGGEYNVAYALARLGLRSAWVGGLVDNPLGALVANHARSVGMDISHAVTLPYDGVGRAARMGLNFTEVGTGVRASVTMYDRGHSATSVLEPGSIDWQHIFSERGVRWLHTGGIFTALSPQARAIVAEALAAAKAAGTVVSYDLNFRSKLWSSAEAQKTSKPLMQYVDVLIGNEEDFQQVLGYEVAGTDENLSSLPIDNYKDMVRRVCADYPNLAFVGTTLREVQSGLLNNWSAICYDSEAKTFHHGPSFKNLEIEDRVGGGDGFASGFIYGLLGGKTPAQAVHLGTAHGALLQSTRGDTSQITLAELEHVAAGGSARIKR